MIMAQNEILKEESVARIEMQRQELEHRKKEIELLSQRKETTHINSLSFRLSIIMSARS